MGKFERIGWGFAKKGTKILRHCGTKVNLPLPTGEVDFVSERSEFTKSGEGSIFKVINGAKSNCHPEFISGSVDVETLKQVQGDNVFVYNGKRVLKKCAFTLSEVLIVLAVLGVVAAMTIPDLIQDYREKALITALKKNYSVFSQAVDMAIAENGAPNTWDIGVTSGTGALKLYKILEPYLRIGKTCGTSTGCFADHYEALFNTTYVYPPDIWGNYARGILSSGASFYTYSRGSGCPDGFCAQIGVDVNGKSGPNKAGVDFFWFSLFDSGYLEPAGKTMPVYGPADCPCKYNNTSSDNGPTCTWWVLKHENMDYLRKAGKYTNY